MKRRACEVHGSHSLNTLTEIVHTCLGCRMTEGGGISYNEL